MFKRIVVMVCMVLLCERGISQPGATGANVVYVNFYNSSVQLTIPANAGLVNYADFNSATIKIYYNKISRSNYQYILRQLLTYKEQLNLNDYFYYKLVSTADKSLFHDDNLSIFYDWFFMTKSGYDVRLLITRGNHLLLSAATDEHPENISYYNYNDKSYVMLNTPEDKYNHPFISAFPDEKMSVGGTTLFSFQLYGEPHIPLGDSIKRIVHFNHKGKDYFYTYYLSKNMLDAFSNYPSVDEGFNCNVDASDITYRSLILQMKHDVSNMDTLSGLSFILSFVRTSTHYERDLQQFGKVKWMIPEEALYYNSNDCADRAPLMVYLVKAIYNLPVILLNYPDHLTMAVALDRPPFYKAPPFIYDNKKYYMCEATELTDLLGVGEIPKQLRNQPYHVVCSSPGYSKNQSAIF